MKIKIKWKPFIGLLSPPFSYPPYLPFTPLFQKTPFKIKFVLEKLAHIIETIVVESLTLSLKSSLLNHPLPPWPLPQNWQLFSLWTLLLHFIIITTMQLWKRTEIYKYYLALKLPEKTHTPPHYCLLTKVWMALAYRLHWFCFDSPLHTTYLFLPTTQIKQWVSSW